MPANFWSRTLGNASGEPAGLVAQQALRPRKEAEDGLQLLRPKALQRLPGIVAQALPGAFQSPQRGGGDADKDAAAVLRIPLPPGMAGSDQAVDHTGGGSGRHPQRPAVIPREELRTCRA
jgi:hypothetical protein